MPYSSSSEDSEAGEHGYRLSTALDRQRSGVGVRKNVDDIEDDKSNIRRFKEETAVRAAAPAPLEVSSSSGDERDRRRSSASARPERPAATAPTTAAAAPLDDDGDVDVDLDTLLFPAGGNGKIPRTVGQLKKLKIGEVRAELERRGLPSTGLKAALVERLAQAEANDDDVVLARARKRRMEASSSSSASSRPGSTTGSTRGAASDDSKLAPPLKRARTMLLDDDHLLGSDADDSEDEFAVLEIIASQAKNTTQPRGGRGRRGKGSGSQGSLAGGSIKQGAYVPKDAKVDFIDLDGLSGEDDDGDDDPRVVRPFSSSSGRGGNKGAEYAVPLRAPVVSSSQFHQASQAQKATEKTREFARSIEALKQKSRSIEFEAQLYAAQQPAPSVVPQATRAAADAHEEVTLTVKCLHWKSRLDRRPALSIGSTSATKLKTFQVRVLRSDRLVETLAPKVLALHELERIPLDHVDLNDGIEDLGAGDTADSLGLSHGALLTLHVYEPAAESSADEGDASNSESEEEEETRVKVKVKHSDGDSKSYTMLPSDPISKVAQAFAKHRGVPVNALVFHDPDGGVIKNLSTTAEDLMLDEEDEDVITVDDA